MFHWIQCFDPYDGLNCVFPEFKKLQREGKEYFPYVIRKRIEISMSSNRVFSRNNPNISVTADIGLEAQ